MINKVGPAIAAEAVEPAKWEADLAVYEAQNNLEQAHERVADTHNPALRFILEHTVIPWHERKLTRLQDQ